MFNSPVLRVFTTSMETCFDMPWQKQRPQKGTGSGVYLGNNLILTGAHVVHDATFIQVQKLSSAHRTIATVKSICHDADLALLSVTDASFLDDLDPAPLGALPELKDKVEVVGFPTGGEQVSVTNGVVSRIEVNAYSHSWRYLLCVTIDAAINPGNSGGPVFNSIGEVVGIAFQKNSNAENSGQMIPPPVIANFLREAKQGKREVFIPMLGISTQKLENPTLKTKFGVPEEASGVLVTSVDFQSSAWGTLEIGDVLHQIGDYSISCMGTIQYLGRYRTRFSVVLSECCEGDTIKLLRRRNGELTEVKVTLGKYNTLTPSEEGITNRYYIHGGLVFQPLTRKYLQTWKTSRHAPTPLRYFYSVESKTESRQEIIVLSHVLADEVNVGYADFNYRMITEVNGIAIRDLNHLIELIEASEEVIEFKTLHNEWIILDAKLAHSRQKAILERYQISSASML